MRPILSRSRTASVVPEDASASSPGWAAVQALQVRRQNRLILAVLLSRLVGFVSRLLLVPFYADVMTQLRVGYTELGLVVSAYLVGYGLALIPAGSASDRFHPRPLLALGTGLLALALPAMVYAPNWYAAAAARAIMGVATALIFSPVQKLVVVYFPPERRGQAFAWQEVAVATGSLFSLAVTPLLALRFTMAQIHWAFALVSAISALLVMLVKLPDPVAGTAETAAASGSGVEPPAPALEPLAAADSPRGTGRWRQLWADWRSRGLLLLALEFALGSWVVSVIYSWLNAYLTEGAGWPTGRAALGMGLLLGIQTIAGLTIGRIIARVQRRSLLLAAGGVLFALSSVILALGVSGPPPTLFLAAALMGVVPTLTFVSLFSMSGDRLDPRTAGVGLSTLNTVNQIAYGLSSGFYGWLLDLVGSFQAVWLTAGAVALLLAALAFWTREPALERG